jgi:DNA-binding response OmpR family regulator
MSAVVVVEDDPRIRHAVVRALKDLGHAVAAFDTGMSAVEHVVREAPDVVVLDLGLPDIDGTQLLKLIRGVSNVPIIVATARDGDEEIVATLDAGADDYVVKPFSGAQLDARIRAVLRRVASQGDDPTITVPGLVIDIRGRRAVLGEEELALTRREFDVLAYLAQRTGEVVTKKELLTEVWRQPWGGDKTVDVHLSWLRRKLGESAAEPRYLHTVRGVGVKFMSPAQ